MSNFKSSVNSGRYPSGIPYTSFHKEGQEFDKIIGVNIIKASFWRSLSYASVFIGLFFIVILNLVLLSSPSLLRVIEVSEKGKVLFWGELEKEPILINRSIAQSDNLQTSNSVIENKNWQDFLNKRGVTYYVQKK